MKRDSFPRWCALFPAVFLLFPFFANADWVFQESHATNASFRAVHAVNSEVVWVSGSAGTCLRTTNGGAFWEKLLVPDAGQLDFRGNAAFDAMTAIVMSAGEAERGLCRMLRTSDGGNNWQVVFRTEEKGAFLDCIAFWDAQNGLVLGDPVDGKAFLLRTSDGGRTWIRLTGNQFPSLLANEASFAAGNSAMILQGTSNVWIATGGADRARVFASSDRGQTWLAAETPMPSGPTAGIFGIRFFDLARGIGVGGDHQRVRAESDNTIITSDAGRTWRKAAPTNPPGLKEAVVGLDRDLLLAVGPSGTSLSRDFGGSWEAVDSSQFHAAAVVEGQCWAVGGRGMIAKWK